MNRAFSNLREIMSDVAFDRANPATVTYGAVEGRLLTDRVEFIESTAIGR